MSNNKKKRGLFAVNLSRRTRIIIGIVAAVVVVLAIVIVALVMLVNESKPTASTAPLSAEQKRQAAIQDAQHREDVAVDAQSAMERGDSDKVAAIYQGELKNTKDVNKKIQLLIDESRTFLYGGKYDKAIQAAKTAEPLSTDKYLIADWLAQVYYSAKQYTLSAQYYVLAGKWVDSPNNTGRYTVDYYVSKAKAMLALTSGKS